MLAVFDIDGTLRTVPDPWLHLHRHLGTAEKGEEFFMKWKAGEISYREMARLDVSVWNGFDRSSMLQSLESNPIRPGAKDIIRWFNSRGIPCVGISTGLSLFNEITKQELGIDEVISNDIVFVDEVCTGSVVVNVEETDKAELLQNVCQQYHCEPERSAIAFGDGNADIPMFRGAFLSVAVFPRNPDVATHADIVVDTEPINTVCEELEQRLGGM